MIMRRFRRVREWINHQNQQKDEDYANKSNHDWETDQNGTFAGEGAFALKTIHDISKTEPRIINNISSVRCFS